MPNSDIQKLIGQKCGIGSWAYINNPNIALAYLDLLEPSDLDEVTIMMSWEEFEDYDKETLQEELAEWYWSIAKTTVPDAFMLKEGYEYADMTQIEYIDYMRNANLPTDVIVQYITECALEKAEDEERRALTEQLITTVLQPTWPDAIKSISDKNNVPPCEENNFMLSEHGNSYRGFFCSMGSKHYFEIIYREDGVWDITSGLYDNGTSE
jgi:hypothetical protein